MKKLKLLTALAVTILFFTSCDKEVGVTPNSSINENLNSKGMINSSNKSGFYVLGSDLNPYNSIGYEHNVILEFMRQSYSPSKSNQNLFNDVVAFASSDLGYDKLDSIFDNGNLDSHIIGYTVPTEFYSEILSMNSAGTISNAAYDYLKSMLDVGLEAPCESCTYNEAVELAIQDISVIEESVSLDNSLIASEKEMIFIALSVCKYSMDFWRQEAQRVSSNYSISLLGGNGTGEDFVPNISWWKADAVGAIATFYAGGSILMGINFGLGAGAMAVGGAMASMA